MTALDGHNFQQFGFIDGQADNSNIALAGAWDMPFRTGKTHHLWAKELEPYLRDDEIFFAGRDIYYTFLVNASSRQMAIEQCYAFYDILGELTELKTLSTDYGSFDVYVKEEIPIEYLGSGCAKGKITFRQPVVDTEGGVLLADNVAPSIDGISFTKFGITLLDCEGDLNRPGTSEGKFSVYGKEGFSVTKPLIRMINLKLLIVQPSYEGFNSAIQSLIKLLSSPNARILDMDGYSRECFAKDGFKVTSLYQQGTGFVATIDLKLTEIRVLTDYNVLADALGNILTDGNGVPLSKIFKQQ